MFLLDSSTLAIASGATGLGLWDEVCSPKMQWWSLLALADLFVINSPYTVIVLATVYWAPSAQGGVTRQGVVLTYLLSFVIDSQYLLLLFLLHGATERMTVNTSSSSSSSTG